MEFSIFFYLKVGKTNRLLLSHCHVFYAYGCFSNFLCSSRSTFNAIWANLNQQIEIAKKLNQINSSTPVQYSTYHFQLSDRSIEVLRKLAPANKIYSSKKSYKAIKVDYKYPQHEFQENGFAHLEVFEK